LLTSVFLFFVHISFGSSDNTDYTDADLQRTSTDSYGVIDSRFREEGSKEVVVSDDLEKAIDNEQQNLTKLIQRDVFTEDYFSMLAGIRVDKIILSFENKTQAIKIFLEMEAKSDLRVSHAIHIAEIADCAIPLLEHKSPHALKPNSEEETYDRKYYQSLSCYRTLVSELIINGAQDLVAQPVLMNIIDQPYNVSGKYEVLYPNKHFDDKGYDISENRLAWLFESNLNIGCMANDIGKFFGFIDKKEKCESYVPYPTNKSALKHRGIQLATGNKNVVYYDSDSRVHGLPKDKNYPHKESDSKYRPYTQMEIDKYQIGFNNNAIILALTAAATQWDIKQNTAAEKDKGKYNWFEHNCQDFIVEVIKEYLKQLDHYKVLYHKIYLKRISYSIRSKVLQ
jgi:hypothetical protein